jgi:hypothetical protein
MSDIDLNELAEELSEFDAPQKQGGRSAREERIIAGFEEVQRFVTEHGRVPQHGEDRDIFERLYAVRLDRLRTLADCRSILEPLDHQGLLRPDAAASEPQPDEIDDDALLAELAGVEDQAGSITELRHVRSSIEKQAAEEIANRERCVDFDRFKPLFTSVQSDLDSGVRVTQPIRKDAGFMKTDIRPGEFFILGGQVAYVAEVGDPIRAPNGETDARLRVIYSNGTESNLLLRSLQRALYKDEASRRVSEPSAGPLFANASEADDLASGTIYVLRSKSETPIVAANRNLVHKIGVTGGDVGKRIVNARLDPTFLLADVEVVATYKLFNVNRTKLENLIHRIFAPARLDITIQDRFGNPVEPREWFLVPLQAIDQAVERIMDGTITNYNYDPHMAALVPARS